MSHDVTPSTITNQHDLYVEFLRNVTVPRGFHESYPTDLIEYIKSLAVQVADLTRERDALAAAMPSEGADAALAYAVAQSALAAEQARVLKLLEALEYSRKYVYIHQRTGDKHGMQIGQVPTVYPEDLARIDAAIATAKA